MRAKLGIPVMLMPFLITQNISPADCVFALLEVGRPLAISKAKGVTVTADELKRRCWGGDDPDKLAGVLKQMNGKTLEQ
jgi:hypothetical protein